MISSIQIDDITYSKAWYPLFESMISLIQNERMISFIYEKQWITGFELWNQNWYSTLLKCENNTSCGDFPHFFGRFIPAKPCGMTCRKCTKHKLEKYRISYFNFVMTKGVNLASFWCFAKVNNIMTSRSCHDVTSCLRAILVRREAFFNNKSSTNHK